MTDTNETDPTPDLPAPDEVLPPHTDADAPDEHEHPSSDLDGDVFVFPGFAPKGSRWLQEDGTEEAPEPESDMAWTADEPVAPHLQPPTPQPISIAVIGSAAWRSRSAVLEVVQDFWHGIGAPPVTLHVSGCTQGAERIIAEAANALGWTLIGSRDEDLGRIGLAHAFAFIRDYSEGAERALTILQDARVPVTVMREESPAVARDPWSNR